jgi:hypothetical protein
MLIVKIELHSAVSGEIKTVATGKIVNTGTGSPTQGNYRIELRDAAGRLWKTGHIEGFPRKRLLAWDLLYRVLKKLIGDRDSTLVLSPFRVVPNGEQHEPSNKEQRHDRPTVESERHPEAP